MQGQPVPADSDLENLRVNAYIERSVIHTDNHGRHN